MSTHPVFYSNSIEDTFVGSKKFEEYKWVKRDENIQNIIGNDVWIGTGATIMEGLTIGDGAIIAANAHVVKDVPPYAIVGGNPAKIIIKYRFTSAQIDRLLKIKWWDINIERLRKNADLFEDVNLFLSGDWD